MSEAIDLKNVIDEIISSYEAKVQSVSDIVDNTFDSTYLTVGEFRECLADAREERNKINCQLREILARNGHLRKKDFDNMMQDILRAQEEREEEIKKLLKDYFNEQKRASQSLRASLNEFRTALAKGEFQKIKEFQTLVKTVLLKQGKAKQEITEKLAGYQKEQYLLSSKPKELLAKANELRIKDFKSMLKELKKVKEERLSLQEKRKEEVAQMLRGFKEKRKRSAPLGAVHPALLVHGKKEEGQKGGVNIDAQGGQKES